MWASTLSTGLGRIEPGLYNGESEEASKRMQQGIRRTWMRYRAQRERQQKAQEMQDSLGYSIFPRYDALGRMEILVKVYFVLSLGKCI